MTRGIDQMQHVVPGIGSLLHRPWQPDVLRFDGDAALTLDVHSIQVLRAHVAVGDHTGQLQHPVGKGGLAVIDVGDDAEVPNLRRRRKGLVGEAADGIS